MLHKILANALSVAYSGSTQMLMQIFYNGRAACSVLISSEDWHFGVTKRHSRKSMLQHLFDLFWLINFIPNLQRLIVFVVCFHLDFGNHLFRNRARFRILEGQLVLLLNVLHEATLVEVI